MNHILEKKSGMIVRVIWVNHILKKKIWNDCESGMSGPNSEKKISEMIKVAPQNVVICFHSQPVIIMTEDAEEVIRFTDFCF